MKEFFDDTEDDDPYAPVEISKSEGYYKDVPTTHYAITVEADFDEEFEAIIEHFELDVNGYTLEGIFLAYLEKEDEALVEHIVSFDTENSTFVAYADSKESQHR